MKVCVVRRSYTYFMEQKLANIKNSETLQRKFLTSYRSLVPEKMYYLSTTMIKFAKSRNLDFSMNQDQSDKEVSKAILPANLVVVMTHDLDSKDCYQKADTIADTNKSFDIPSTFNLLTNGSYKLNNLDLDRWHGSGIEIGIHGDSHDLGFYDREPKEIEVRLQRMIRRLEDFSPTSYRHPGLGYSDTLFKVLSENGFKCDSSIASKYLKPRSIYKSHTFDVNPSHIKEIPLSISDDQLFRENRFSDMEALEYVNIVSELIRSEGGVLCMNFHPMFLVKRPNFYEKLCTMLRSKEKVLFKNLRDMYSE